MHLQWLLLFLSMVMTSFATNTNPSKAPNNISKPGCPQKCGNLIITYPFGIGPECSMGPNAWFSIHCNTSYNPPKAFSTISLAFLGESEILVINKSQIIIRNTQIASRCYDSKGNMISDVPAYFDIYASPFTYSYTANKLTVIGCDDYALVTASSGTTSKGNKQGYSVGCLALCSDPTEVTRGSCSGLGCCQTSIPSGLQSFEVSLSSIYNHTRPPEVAVFQPCGYAFLAGGDAFSFGGASDFVGKTVVNRTRDGVPLVLDWVAGNINSSLATTLISDIDECSAGSKSPCSMVCVNTPGSYECSCPSGYDGDGNISGTGCTKNTNRTLKSLTLGNSQ